MSGTSIIAQIFVPLNKLLIYQHSFIVAYYSNIVLKMATIVQIITQSASFGIGTRKFEIMQHIFKNNLI